MYKCGTDIVKVERINEILKNKKNIIDKIFTKEEIEYCSVSNEKQTALHFSGRFAAKEAIYKAVSGTNIQINSWKDIEIINEGKKLSKPIVKIHGIKSNNIDVSISHESEFAIAMAIYTE